MNTHQALKMGFEWDDFVILVEGDVVLGKDALNYYEWCRKKFERNKDIFTITAYSALFHEGLEGQVNEPNGKKTLCYRPHFSGVTFGIWRDRWDEVRHQWIDGLHPTSCKPMPDMGWDWRMRKFRGNRLEVYPLWSRANHIGLTGGLNCGYDAHNKILLDEKWYYENTYVKVWAEQGNETEFIE